jgi:hypothetical protein
MILYSIVSSEQAILQISKLLASQTLSAIKWLYNQQRITFLEKQKLMNNVITHYSKQQFSKIETAYSLIIGPGRPDELLTAAVVGEEKVIITDRSSDNNSPDRSNNNNNSNNDINNNSNNNNNNNIINNNNNNNNNEMTSEAVAMTILSYNIKDNLSLIDMDTLDEDIVTEFEDICHTIAAALP